MTDHDVSAGGRLREAIVAAFGSPGHVRNWIPLVIAAVLAAMTVSALRE